MCHIDLLNPHLIVEHSVGTGAHGCATLLLLSVRPDSGSLIVIYAQVRIQPCDHASKLGPVFGQVLPLLDEFPLECIMLLFGSSVVLRLVRSTQ